ncbi:dehydrin Xero 1 [Ricinus communis]|uniref:Dehydrin Xero, putative n=1 Tax=Ricinus communis TaxID=3988 RepID=B9S696_RICCO|nr:dehydrin Xero 1 [Ricinus communis]EEF40786.1 Dehydrin Xero, putative [Ricinus communis]|eukprot:XP_002521515.1 dehydrin Xero 1 [Ricinus communis]
MAEFQHQYGEVRYDKYGNPVPQTDQYGNPISHSGSTDVYGVGQQHHQGQGITGELHRSGGSSSSSEEDDEHGGRRKKGLKEKIKEKLPGHKKDRPHATSTTTPGGYSSAEQHGHEKKGVMEKIKEKLPGGHRDEQQQHYPEQNIQHRNY